jgi:NADH-quinone oxidoreductase subunit G
MKIENPLGKDITVTIDGKECSGKYGQTILQIAREHDIYIPTMCYLTKVAPISSCRMCVVEVEGNNGFALSCQENAIDGAVVNTNSSELFKHRQNIMKLYNVNHPLQCGVCDKSGECELQNKTLEFQLNSQEFSAKEQKRKAKKWGVLSYDPYLCILCERCVHTCNESVGSTALLIKQGGYKSEIDIKMKDCIQCGECISVCPVGALTSTNFKYSANAWEGLKIPAANPHSSDCTLIYYEVKNGANSNIGKDGKTLLNNQKITRVTNESEFSTISGAARFSFAFQNTLNEPKDEAKFDKTIAKFKEAKTILFDSYITNEEALILQKLKEQFGYKLINPDAKAYQNFMSSYSSISGKLYYSATMKDVAKSDFVMVIGSKIANDAPVLKNHINKANKDNRAEVIYAHPIEDTTIKKIVTKFVKYEAGSEEAMVGLLASYLVDLDKVDSDKFKNFIDELDVGYLSAESNIGEEELEDIAKRIKNKKSPILIIGEDAISHSRASNIAKIVGLIEKYTNIKVLIIPTSTNTLGVSVICELDEEILSPTIGYNVKADYNIGSRDACEFQLPSLNSQEGTFTNIDKKVVPTNVAIDFLGYELNDIANKLGIKSEYTVDYTSKLPASKGYSSIDFDDLECYYDNSGNEIRGYELENISTITNIDIEDVEDLSTYDGAVIYRCEPISQFNYNTAKASIIKDKSVLRGSQTFATASKIHGGDTVVIDDGKSSVEMKFIVDKHLSGTIALFPTYTLKLNDESLDFDYRFKKVKISKKNPDKGVE